jgi:hypothetical protein
VPDGVVVVVVGGALVVVVDGLDGGGEAAMVASRVEQTSAGGWGRVTGTVPGTGTTNSEVPPVSPIPVMRPPK